MVLEEKKRLWKIGSIGNEDFMFWLIDYLLEEIDKKEDKKVVAEAEETKIDEDPHN